MIFVTVGSQKFPFERLLDNVDDLIKTGTISEPVFAQIGCNSEKNHRFDFEKFIDRDLFRTKMQAADVVITHAGTGAIVSALQMGKKVIAMPRKSDLGEHVDDHQFEIAQAFSDANYISVVTNREELAMSLKSIKSHTFNKFESNTGKYIEYINNFVNKR